LTFAQPLYLLLLILPALVLVALWQRERPAIAVPYDHGRAGTGRWLAVLLRIGESLPSLLLGVAIVMLANPQRLSVPRTKRALTNIQFCFDVSGSMTAKFGEGSRHDAAMKAIDRFLDLRKGDAFGLTFFSDQVLNWVPLTSDPSAFRCAPALMRPEFRLPGFGSGTQIGKALLACREMLISREGGDRMVILVSDGQSSDLHSGRAQEIASRFRSEGIAVWGVHIAEPPIPDEIIDITRGTGGDAFNPEDQAGLDAVFAQIDKMQEAKLEQISGEFLDDFAPWCIAGLAVLGLVVIVLFTARPTPW